MDVVPDALGLIFSPPVGGLEVTDHGLEFEQRIVQLLIPLLFGGLQFFGVLGELFHKAEGLFKLLVDRLLIGLETFWCWWCDKRVDVTLSSCQSYCVLFPRLTIHTLPRAYSP